MKKIKPILMLLLLSTNSLNSFADDNCKDIEVAAEQAVASGDRVVDLRMKEIKAQQDVVDLQSKEIIDLQSQENSFWRDPKVIFAFGVLAGFAAVSVASKVGK